MIRLLRIHLRHKDKKESEHLQIILQIFINLHSVFLPID